MALTGTFYGLIQGTPTIALRKESMMNPQDQKPLPPERGVVLIRSASLQLGVCRSNEALAIHTLLEEKHVDAHPKSRGLNM
jgi:hypothetical protein